MQQRIEAKRREALEKLDTELKAYYEHYRIPVEHIKIVKERGEGGYAKVLECKWIESGGNEDVAVKVLKFADCKEDTIKMIINEVKTLCNLHHVNICKTFGLAVNKQTFELYVVMELAEGNLLDCLSLNDELVQTNLWKCKTLLQTAKGINFLHSKGCMHRDIKSQNILVFNNQSICKISDFGMATIATTNSSFKKLRNAGTKRWKAPETYTSEFTTAADVFSFGMVIYEVCTGNVPFFEYDDDKAYHKIINGCALEIPKNIQVNEKLVALMMKCIDKNPKNRPNMYQVVCELETMVNSIETIVNAPVVAKAVQIPLPPSNNTFLSSNKSAESYNSGSSANSSNSFNSMSIEFDNACDQCYNGIRFYYGIGRSAKPDIGLQLLLQAAQSENFVALYSLVVLYRMGAAGMKPDYELAEEYTARYKTATETHDVIRLLENLSSHAAVKNILGMCYFRGRGVSLDNVKAVEFFKGGAELNFAPAQHNLGFCYEYAKGVPQSNETAKQWYIKSHNQNYVPATAALGTLLQKCALHKEAFIYFKNAADNQHVASMYIVGIYYYEGKGCVTKNMEQAIKYLNSAAGLKNEDAALKLAQIYLEQNKDIQTAISLLQFCINKSEAMLLLGKIYAAGEKVSKNINKAFEFLTRAEKLGNEEATKLKIKLDQENKQVIPVKPEPTPTVPKAHPSPNNINYHSGGDNIVNNVTRLQREANSGNCNAMYTLGKMYLEGTSVSKNMATALRYLDQAAQRGHEESLSKLGQMYFYGNEGVEEDLVKAREYLEQLVEQHSGYSKVYLILAKLYESGKGGIKSMEIAIMYYEKAANEADSTEAQTKLGILYAKGEGKPKNVLNAIYYLSKATKKNDPIAHFYMGHIYDDSGLIKTDYAKAMYHYIEAANNGNIDAVVLIGLMYERGNGVQQDITKALMHYEMASKKGNILAALLKRRLEEKIEEAEQEEINKRLALALFLSSLSK